jgi:hypothetical protein
MSLIGNAKVAMSPIITNGLEDGKRGMLSSLPPRLMIGALMLNQMLNNETAIQTILNQGTPDTADIMAALGSIDYSDDAMEKYYNGIAEIVNLNEEGNHDIQRRAANSN